MSKQMSDILVLFKSSNFNRMQFAFDREKCLFDLPYLMIILLSHVMLHLIFLFMWVVYFCGIKFSWE